MNESMFENVRLCPTGENDLTVVLPTLRGRWFWGMGLGGLELFGAHLAQRAVQSVAIVEHLNELEDRGLGLGAGRVAVGLQLALEGGEEAFAGSVVVAVAATAHRTQQAMIEQQLLIGATGILPASIGVADQSRSRRRRRRRCSPVQPLIDRHLQRAAGQLACDLMMRRPADDPAAEQVHQRRQVEPALFGADVADVAGPDAVDPIDGKASLQSVGRIAVAVIAVGGARDEATAPRLCRKPAFTQDFRDRVDADLRAATEQVRRDPRGAP